MGDVGYFLSNRFKSLPGILLIQTDTIAQQAFESVTE